MEILKYTKKYVVLLTKDGRVFKLQNPGHLNFKDLKDWLAIIADDHDLKMRKKEDL